MTLEETGYGQKEQAEWNTEDVQKNKYMKRTFERKQDIDSLIELLAKRKYEVNEIHYLFYIYQTF